MATYLSAPRIARAVERLSESRAKTTLFEFLIVKRTLAVKGQAAVAIAETESSLEHERFNADLYALAVDSAFDPPAYEARAAAPEKFPPGIVVLLKTCVFLC